MEAWRKWRIYKSMRDTWEHPSAQTYKGEVQEEGTGCFSGEAETLDEPSEIASSKWPWENWLLAVNKNPSAPLALTVFHQFFQTGKLIPSPQLFFFFLPIGMQHSWLQLDMEQGLLQILPRERSGFHGRHSHLLTVRKIIHVSFLLQIISCCVAVLFTFYTCIPCVDFSDSNFAIYLQGI